MGYVPCSGQSAQAVPGSTFGTDVTGKRVRARAGLKPLHDPKAERREA
jgi:4-methylaminobutanoate oxidase (formaldehyde-forming)